MTHPFMTPSTCIGLSLKRLLLITAATLGAPSVAATHDWPGYLGPDRNSISPDPTPLADSWPESGPREVWSKEVKPGHGGAAIVDGKIYMMDRVDGVKDVLMVMDLQTGDLLESSEVASEGRVNYPGARGVPMVTDHHVFASGPMGTVAAWKRKDLSLLWTIDIVDKFDSEPLHFGYAVHPQPYKNLVIISTNAEDASVVALHADTGKVAWKAPGLHGTLSSPIIRRFQGRDQVLYLSNETPENPKGGKPVAAGLDPETGKLLWKYEGFPLSLPIPPPIVVDDQSLFVTGGYEAGAQLLRFSTTQTPRIQVKESFKWGSHICPPIVHDGHIYFLTHENASLQKKSMWPEFGLNCITVDGKHCWTNGSKPMFGRGSMILADGKLIIRDSYHGKLYLVKPSPEGYQQLAEANPFEHRRKDLKRWAPLAISRGLLVIRDEREIKCLDLRKP